MTSGNAAPMANVPAEANAAWTDAREDAGDLAKRQAAYQSAIKNGQNLMLKKDYDDAAKAFRDRKSVV